jgi:SPP1 gp7 family putative phage head morphogenesis protein
LLLIQEIKETLSLISPVDAKLLTTELSYLLTSVNALGETLGTELMNAIEQGSATNSGRLPLQQVALAVEQTTNRLKATGTDFADKASSVIGMGMAQGWGVGKTATALRSTLGVSKGRAETEVRTSVIQAANTAAQMTYAANGVSLVMLNATADKRVCGRCAARNQWVYRIGEIMVPIHQNCRCFTSPYKQSWYDSGLMNSEFIKDFRGKVIDEVGRDRLDYSASPMERKGGLTEPPKPVWKPS